MSTLIAIALSLIFIALSGIHFYWAFGGKWGGAAAIPTKENNEPVMKPRTFETLIVALGLLGFGLFVLIKSGFIQFRIPEWFMDYGMWIITAIFFLRAIGEFRYVGFFKRIKGTHFAEMDTKLFSPLCLVIALLAVLIETYA